MATKPRTQRTARGGRASRSIAEQQADPIGIHQELAELHALIRLHHEPTQVRLVITQPMAVAMLRLMDKNRKLSRVRVERLKKILVERRWHEIHTGFAFDINGKLRDGQHRLTAIAETGIAVPMWVMFGMDPKSFPAIDVGYKRTAGQNLDLDNVRHADLVAAIVRLKYRIDNQGSLADDELVHRLGREMADPDEVLERAIICATRLRKEKPGTTVSSAALAYWLIAKQSKRKLSIDEFWDHLAEGHELGRTNPIFLVRKKLDTLRDVGRKAKQYLSQTQQTAWIIMAWNVWITKSPAPGTTGWPIWRNQHSLPRVD